MLSRFNLSFCRKIIQSSSHAAIRFLKYRQSCTNITLNSSNSSAEWNGQQLNMEDITLLCDLFYLPFEHGTQGVQLLQEFNWLHTNAHVVGSTHTKPEVDEWHERAKKLEDMSIHVNKLFQKLNGISNKELMYELYPYVWEMRAVISTLNSYIKWLGGGKMGQSENPAIGNYTWFSKGWKESFMSGDQEPWVFRGGLTADLQRLIPVDGGSDLFVYKVPQVASSTIYTIREYDIKDEEEVLRLSRNNSAESSSESCERLVECMLRLKPNVSFVVEEEKEDEIKVVGFAIALLDARAKITETEDPASVLTFAINGARPQHPSLMTCSVHPSVTDQSVSKRVVICLLAALRANGSCGTYTPINSQNQPQFEFYSKLGFVEMSRDDASSTVYVGRVF